VSLRTAAQADGERGSGTQRGEPVRKRPQQVPCVRAISGTFSGGLQDDAAEYAEGLRADARGGRMYHSTEPVTVSKPSTRGTVALAPQADGLTRGALVSAVTARSPDAPDQPGCGSGAPGAPRVGEG
jgi:hypothetical protein